MLTDPMEFRSMLPIHVILCPTDFSAHADRAFHIACSLAREYVARVIVLHVVAIPQWEVGLDDLRERLSGYTSPDGTVVVERLLLDGQPVEEILDIARERPCDLIVLGTHGQTEADRPWMGSVAEAVLREAPCPVLTVGDSPSILHAEEPAALGAATH